MLKKYKTKLMPFVNKWLFSSSLKKYRNNKKEVKLQKKTPLRYINNFVYTVSNELHIRIVLKIEVLILSEVKMVECDENQIYNPKTKRCVLKSDKIGQQLLVKHAKAAEKKVLKFFLQ